MKTRERRLCVTVLLWLLTIKHAKTDGKLDIRFISYWSDGRDSSGYCCDSGTTWCTDKCDPMFTLCIDGPDRRPCSVYKTTTKYIDNHNIIHFGSSIQGTPNPFTVHISKAIPSSIEIKVDVYDNDDTSGDDHMDTLSKLINIQAAATQQAAVYTPYTVWGSTKLKIAVRAYCDPDWYGSTCEKYCKATPGHSHYTCQAHTGAKMCFEGWKGDNCNQDIDECIESDDICKNGGSCTNTPGSFECACVAGIKGKLCENIINQCALKPCLNGGTCGGNEAVFKCACPVEWTGDTCADEVNFCDSSPCNMGQCTPDLLTATRFKCDCDFPWVGERCNQSVDIFNITLLGEIDHTNRGDLADGLKRLVIELGGIPGKVDVNFRTNTKKESNYTTTHVHLYSVVENGSFLESSSFDRIFESNPDEVIDEYLPLPLFPPREEEEVKAKVIPTVMVTNSPHDSWETNQYVSAILPPVGLVLMTVLLLVAFWTWRKRSGKRENRLRTVVTVVPCNRNLNRPGTNTGNLHDASVSSDGSTCTPIHDVDEGSVDTHCDDTSHIQVDTGVVIVQLVRRHDDEAPPDTHCDDAAHIDVGTGAMTLQSVRRQGLSVSLDDNAGHDDAAPPNAHCGGVSHINICTGAVTFDSGRLQVASEALDDNARQWDFEARLHVTSHTGLPLDMLPCSSVHDPTQTRNYEPFGRCEEEDEECTVVDDNNVEDISEENPYVHLVAMKRKES